MISSRGEYDLLISQNQSVVCFFTAEKCCACKPIGNILNELKSEYPTVTFATIDAKVQVRPIHVYPTLISFYEGKELEIVKGADKYQLLKMLENLKKESDFISYWSDKTAECNIFGKWDSVCTSIGTVELAVNK